jgi:hypothetical protein
VADIGPGVKYVARFILSHLQNLCCLDFLPDGNRSSLSSLQRTPDCRSAYWRHWFKKLIYNLISAESQDSLVDSMTRLRVGRSRGSGSITDRDKFFSFWSNILTASCAHKSSYLMSNGGSFRGIKWTELEANHSLHYMPRLMSAAEFLFLDKLLCIAQRHIYLYYVLATRVCTLTFRDYFELYWPTWASWTPICIHFCFK